ncbi:MAG: hypothetical protein WD628_04395 [Thermomicrobiales bacterium]
MASSDLLLRLDNATLEWLDSEGQRSGQTRSELAEALIDEALRMQAHPGIVFRPGPAGRRPALAFGPDIWEFARVVQAVEGTEDETIEKIAEFTFLTPDQARVALGYYVEYRDEIDEWIRLNDEEIERARVAWLRERALLKA